MTTFAGAVGHLRTMTDQFGLFEHCLYATPRREHGYCVDDVARLLVLTTSSGTDHVSPLDDLETLALEFTVAAQTRSGEIRNRRDALGRWEREASTQDCWGRSLWGLGTAASQSTNCVRRSLALGAFERGARQRSNSIRTVAFAALGAASVLEAVPFNESARKLLIDAVPVLTARSPSATWAWPEDRLAYANAVIPNAMLATGTALELEWLTRAGLDLLAWLVDHETSGAIFSVTPVDGAGPLDRHTRFDQQPIELASLADACARAYSLTYDQSWLDGIMRSARWFSGSNDVGCSMIDTTSGGGYDGLDSTGPNLNCGAESTLALATTLAHVERWDCPRIS